MLTEEEYKKALNRLKELQHKEFGPSSVLDEIDELQEAIKEYDEMFAEYEKIMQQFKEAWEWDYEDTELLINLSDKLERYEEVFFPIDLPDPVSAILFRMDQQDLDPVDLVPYIGSIDKVHNILNRKESISG